MSKLKKALKISGLVALVGMSSYCAINSSQIKDSYRIGMLTDDIGKKAMSRKVTKENISKPENQDMVNSLGYVEQRLLDHQTKYNFNIDDNEVNWADVPTLIGVTGCVVASGGSYLKTGEYLYYVKEEQ